MALEIFSSMSFTQTVQSIAASFTGPFNAVQALTLSFRQFGPLCALEIPALTVTGGNTVAAATAFGVIPVGFRPSAQIFLSVAILSNSVLLPAPGKVSINTSGDVSINSDLVGTGLWSALGNCGWSRHCVQWVI